MSRRGPGLAGVLIPWLLLVLWLLSAGPMGGRRPPQWPASEVPVRLVPDEADPASRSGESEALDPGVGIFVMHDGPPGDWALGSAFAAGAGSNVITAAHVTSGCRQVAIQPQPAKRDLLFANEVLQHRRADVAGLRVAHPAPGLPVGDDRALRRGDAGFGFGFPGGDPAAVGAEFVGRAVARPERGGPWFSVLVWTRVARYPAKEGRLAGISGGPLVDPDGRLVGVLIGEGSERRPHLLSTTLEPVLEVIASNDPTRQPLRPSADLGRVHEPAEYGDTLRRQGSVVPVICEVQLSRRGRPTGG